MDTLLEVPALVKILALFAGTVLLFRLKAPLWMSLPVMAFAAVPWFGERPGRAVEIAARSLVSPDTLFLCGVVALIMGFSNLLAETGVLKRIVAAFSALLGRSIYSGAALAALIGLLPMPGGAVFSAPMVEEACGADEGNSRERKAVINYWFRHVWEYWWPLYPGVILASNLFNVSAWTLMLLHLPLTAAALAGGWFFILRQGGEPGGEAGGRGSALGAARESMSILLVIVSIFVAGPLMGPLGVEGIQARYWPVLIGFVLGIALLAATSRVGGRALIRCLATRNQLSMVGIAVGVMVFRDTLTALDAFALAQADLNAWSVPAALVIITLPFVSGLVTGLAIGFVGASFPLVISLLPAATLDGGERFAWLALAYSFGYMGMMLSPVHVCLIVTREFFKADMGGVYRKMAAPSAIVMIVGAMLFGIYLSVF